ncbi:MAG: polysaccharide deacetylase [Sphingomonadales bacterium 32-68-7]|nr:MAG: polysaccharide deacetylase [Sphingomonadales bacterium 12-68-11]OYX08189.1 MAG: polysaccharide deacetylase [Sphingomonadales bacterium 32-68-7]
MLRARRILSSAALALVALVLLAVATNRLSKARCFQLVGEVTCRVDTTERIVALTFDDGPTPEGVDSVLTTLDRYGAKATFFLIGQHLERSPGQAQRLLAAGHELGNHSFSHVRNIGHSREFYAAEIARTSALLRAAGQHPRYFRPPFGRRLIGLPLEVERSGLRMVTWDVEDQPERFTDPARFAEDILARVKPGSIILIHPMYRANETARAALPLVLEGLRQRGYRAVTVSELLKREAA